MAPSFAHIQQGQLNGAANITFTEGLVGRQHYKRNTTNSGSGTAHRSTLGRWIYQISAGGFWDTGSNTYPLPIGTASSNGIIGRLSRIRLTKEQHLTNATADADGVDDMVFVKGVIKYTGRGTGYLQSTEQPMGTDSTQTIAQSELTSFTMPLDGSHDVTADAIVTNIAQRKRFDVGGAVLVDFNFELIDTVKLNGTNHPLDATEFDATIQADNGEQWDGTVVYRRMDLDIDYDNGGPVAVEISGPFSGTPAVAITNV